MQKTSSTSPKSKNEAYQWRRHEWLMKLTSGEDDVYDPVTANPHTTIYDLQGDHLL